MKWETVSSGIGQKAYALWENGRHLLTLVFNSNSKFARIEYGEEKRSFTLRYEGLFRNRLVMRNEYGIRIGELIDEKEQFISLHDEKLFFTVQGGDQPQLVLFRKSPAEPLASCQLQLDKEPGILPAARPTATHHSLLLTLGWYLLGAPHREKKPGLVHNL